MSLLNKFELNKLIVSMRHNVNRAKVQTLNKLSRLSKTLKSKKATENLRLKNEKKAERLVNEILVMKKIPTDEIAAFSLSNTKQVNDILSDVESSLRLRALARLSTHKSISPIVQQFRAKYPSWEEEFPKVLLALKKREKLKPGAGKGSENNPNVQKATKIANIKTGGAAGFQIEDEDSDEYSSGKTEDDSSGCDITDIENNRDISSENVVICTRGNRFSVSSDDVSVSEISPKRSIIEDKFSVQTLRPVKKKIDNSILKQTAFEGNNKGSPLKKQEPTKSEKLAKQNSPNKLPIQKTKKKIDPFFLECDDRPYETFDTANPKSNVKQLNSYNDINASDSEHSDNSEQSFVGEEGVKKIRSNNKISFTTNNKFNKNNVLHNKTNVKQSGKIGLNNKSKLNNKKKAGPKVAPKEINEKLHPSWEAKKKMSVMANYQGKKIVFD